MSDPRLTPFSGRVAHVRLQGQIDAPAFTDGQIMRICAPLSDLLRRPDGPRDRQVLRGARVCVLDQIGDMAYVQAEADGYCGWLPHADLGADHTPTHRVRAPATHLYCAPDLKSAERATLSLNACVEIIATHGKFLQTHDGLWLPQQHLAPLTTHETDPVAVAESLIGTPYLWGGNSRAGLDCSALVQLALTACNHPCPGDSDLQERALGPALAHGTPKQRGDLLFWRGHVAWLSAPDMILHANAQTMSVAYEPLDQALSRIAPEGPVTSHIRPF
ncbi:NlpC/P60 family protein [Roseinatronobacter monicus]|uniref:NlpC/P60 family protein n=1 Tax=Roseinatronobacter monicus TaxID=393481 RepID=A0A543KA59_9RHOB|nr:NlpC/P60 family protein [Roseinatronobacter monicus]TQM91960.1 NlpC/P60 family protein [Roseinatronobacter monicus]